MRSFQAVLSATIRVDSSGRAQLLPATEFAARDGRPGPGQKWKLNDVTGAAIAAALTAVAALTPVVIDYDHQTLYVQANGQKAPAAGWIQQAEWLTGQGLFATVDWTVPAKQHIDAGEYRFISPVITYDEANNLTGVALAALCNYPAIVGMSPVQAALSAQFNFTPLETPSMTLLATLLTALALPATTTEADAVAAVAALKGRPSVPTALVTALGLTAGADETAALTALTTLKTAKPDAATVQLVATLQGQVSALTALVEGDKVVTTVDKAIADKKLTAGQRDAYIELGKTNYAQLTAILAATNPIPGLGGQSQGDPDGGAGGAGGGAAALTTAQRGIAKQLGLDKTAYAATLAAKA